MPRVTLATTWRTGLPRDPGGPRQTSQEVSVVLGWGGDSGGGRSRQGPQLFLQGCGNHQVLPGLSFTLGHAGLSLGGDVLWGSQRSLTPRF